MTAITRFSISYTFWPVGQGLFASGKVHQPESHHTFHWVYDCGTSSSIKFLKTAIKKYKKENFSGADNPQIDLVVLSHFDRDHINGIVQLLTTFKVKTLLLPYMPLWQRLLVAFDSGIDSQQDLMAFYVNPARYLSEIPGRQRVGQIVFIPASGNDPAVENANQDNDDGPFEIRGSFQDLSGSNDAEVRQLLNGKESGSTANPSIKMLSKSNGIFLRNLFEFIPYNDADVVPLKQSKSLKEFQDEVTKFRDKLIEDPKDTTLGELKQLYDNYFGSSSGQRNKISLFMYVGPILHKATTFFCPRPIFISRQNQIWEMFYKCPTRTAIFYTGDGSLIKPQEFDKLENYFLSKRILNISCLQVMHHGSSSSWHEGLADKFSPDVSVFSSNPKHKRYHHPDGCVVRDFLKYTPVQVDQNAGLEVHFELYRKVTRPT